MFVSRLAKHIKSRIFINPVIKWCGKIAVLKYKSDAAKMTGLPSNVLRMGERLAQISLASSTSRSLLSSVTLAQVTPTIFCTTGPNVLSKLMTDICSSKPTTYRPPLWISVSINRFSFYAPFPFPVIPTEQKLRAVWLIKSAYALTIERSSTLERISSHIQTFFPNRSRPLKPFVRPLTIPLMIFERTWFLKHRRR